MAPLGKSAIVWVLIGLSVFVRAQVAPTATSRVERETSRVVTVAQLIEFVQKAKGKHDSGAAKEIEHLQLTARLSSVRLTVLISELPGTQSKNALMAVGDASVFLKPPPDEIPQNASPDLAEQKRMMSLAVDYLKKVVPKLPNFYASRFTTAFGGGLNAKAGREYA